jgi:pyruvate dehydrogenase (quinone)
MWAFMATAHAKFTGGVGACLATSGPGAIHLLNGLYDAKRDHTPVYAIVGQPSTSALGSSYPQEVDPSKWLIPGLQAWGLTPASG